MSQNTLAQLRTCSHAEIKAFALVGMVLLQQINAGRLVVSDAVDADLRINADSIEQTIALIDTGYRIQDAIFSGDDALLPVLIQAFASIADSEVQHGA